MRAGTALANQRKEDGSVTVKECVQYVDEVRPNAFPTEAKIAWVSQVEGRIAAEVPKSDFSQETLLKYAIGG